MTSDETELKDELCIVYITDFLRYLRLYHETICVAVHTIHYLCMKPE